MNIFMSGDTYLPLLGGTEIHIFELRKQLVSAGNNVTLLATQPEPAEEDEHHPVLRVPWNIKNIPRLLRHIWRASKGTDLFHVHNSYRLGVLVGLIAFLHRRPCIVTLHGLGILDIPHNTWFYDKVHCFYRKFSLFFATHIISTSEDLANVCRHYTNTPITVIPNGIDTSKYDATNIRPSKDARFHGASPLLLSVRRLVPKNGIHYLISSMPFIFTKYPNVKLVMIGDGRMRREIEERAKKLGVYDRCLFLGSLPNDQIAPIASLTDVVIFPSTAESTSIACEEMMAMGKKIVASRVGGLIELLGDKEERGWLVTLVPWESSNYAAPNELPEDRYQALAARICSAIEDTDGSKQAAAHTYAQQHLDWTKVAEKTFKVYQKLLTGRDME